MYQTLERVFHRLPKLSAVRRIFHSLFCVWISRWNTLSRVWYIQYYKLNGLSLTLFRFFCYTFRLILKPSSIMSIVFSSLPSPLSCLSLKHTDVLIYECSVCIATSLLMWTTRLLQFRSRSLFTELTLSSGRWDSGNSFRTERYRRQEAGHEIARIVLTVYH